MKFDLPDLFGKKAIATLNAEVLQQQKQNNLLQIQLDALSRSMAVIEFSPTGIITNANENFLKTFGYELDEIVGKHHRMFVLPETQATSEYAAFWERLRRGEFFSDEYLRVGRDGKEIWIQATYNPVISENGVVDKVVKYATDITHAKRANALIRSQTDAVNRAFAVIEFDLQGHILTANENFLSVMGYSISEVVGRHHRIFVSNAYANSDEYARFWKDLRTGRYHRGEFHRVGKGGRDVYIQASYSPIFAIDNSVSSVIKYASDITTAMNARIQSNEVSRSVCTGVSEMTSTNNEISKNVSSTAGLAKIAEELSLTANDNVKSLGDESRSIEKVVEMIRELTDQTNLLALNATIESARAGEAGKGFAIVASEVKDLARQTASATRSIEGTVEQIQAKVNEVMKSMNSISTSVSNVSNNMNMISAAVEEQSHTMNSIAMTAKNLESA
jgi:methyl-accepting chemotaxis protein